DFINLTIKDHLIFFRGQDKFLFNIKTKKEEKLFSSSGYGYSTSGRNDVVHLRGDTTSALINPQTGNFAITNQESYNTVGAYAYSGTSNVLKIRPLDNLSEVLEIQAPEGSFIDLPSPNLLQVMGPVNATTVAVRESYVRKISKWEKIPEIKNGRVSGILSNGNLVVTKMEAKPGQPANLTFDWNNIDKFNVKTEIYKPEGMVKIAETKKVIFVRNGLIVEADISSRPIKHKYFYESEMQNLLKGNGEHPLPISEGSYLRSSQKGIWLAAESPGGNSLIINPKTKKTINVADSVSMIEESADGRRLQLGKRRGNSYSNSVYDLVQGTEVSLGNEIIEMSDNFDRFFKSFDSTPAELKNTCWNDVQVISDDCNCLTKGTDFDSSLKLNDFEKNRDIVLKTYCQGPFTASAWDPLTPVLNKGNLSEKQGLLYLKRFQKKGGFDSRYLSVLAGILQSSLMEKNQPQIENALQTIAGTHPDLALILSKKFKLSERLKKPAVASDESRCEDPETEGFRKATFTTLMSRAKSSPQPGLRENFEFLSFFRRDLDQLPESEKNAMIENITESLSQRAVSDPALAGTFQSKLHYFSKKYAMSLFGKDAKTASDLALAINNGEQNPVILSSSHIKGVDGRDPSVDIVQDPLRYGFHFARLPAIDLPNSAPIGKVEKNSISWETASGKHSAEIESKALQKLSDIVAKDTAPPYQKFMGDQKLTGMMVIGENLSRHAGLADTYVSYYQEREYEFSDPKEVSTLEFMKPKIESGQVDYLIKEAHSDGDENNLFRASDKATLLEGRKKLPDGKEEIIYLLGPSQNSKSSQLISNQDFGAWIRARKNDQPIAYFNSSCSSTRKVISEIGAVHSENFIPYPSAGSVYTFSVSENNGMKKMMDGFLDQKSYDQIRQQISNTANYKNGSDQFLFPDDPAYDREIRANLKMNWDTKITVKDASGKVQNIDENIDH
ncbi:MAG: hypothetical protein ACAH59_00495, partial [Pseudobdellovibrionaceae bacterium]